MSEVKPKFAPAVQAIWNSCGTYVDSINPEVAAGEIEFFVQELISSITDGWNHTVWSKGTMRDFLARKGYNNE